MTILLDRDGSPAARVLLASTRSDRSVTDPTRSVSTLARRGPGSRLCTAPMPPEPSRAVERLTKLVALDTQNTLCSGEAGRRQLHHDAPGGRGLAVEMLEAAPDRPNVVARLEEGDGPVIALNTHVDVVPGGDGWSGDPFRLRNGADGRLYGRGARDARGSLDVARNQDGFVPLDELVATSLIYSDVVVTAAARR